MSAFKRAPLLPPTGHKLTDDAHPYGVLWLDSFFQEVCLPNGFWQQVSDKITPRLAQKVKKQFDNENRKQMIFDLLGYDFVQTYFPNEEYKPWILDPPYLSREARKNLHYNAEGWLKKEVSKVAAEVACERPAPGHLQQPNTCDEMIKCLAQTRFLASKDLDIHLHLQERAVKEAYEKSQFEEKEARLKEKDQLDRIRLRREYERLTGTAMRSILRSIETPSDLKKPGSAASIFTTASQLAMKEEKVTANVKGAEYGAIDDPPVFWGTQSNSIGRSVVALLKRDPRRLSEVTARLYGRQLPGTLRTYLWLDVLLKAERERLNDINAEKLVRARFGKALSRGISDLKIKRASHSPISGLIDNAVIELYDRTPAMRQYLDQNQHMKECARALNILYVYDRTYEPYLVFWLLPLQIAFQSFSGQTEHIYDLALYLDLLNKSCFPSWPRVFAVAERAMARLGEVDRELYTHLETVARVNVNINPKEFLVQLIHEERTRAQQILSSGTTRSPARASPANRELLADPRILLRKWVGEGFVSVLDTQAVVYVWDQCFLQRWDRKVLEDFCLALLLLLRREFMAAKEYKDMKKVFLQEPCKLYTMDIQHAWIHVQKHDDLSKVPAINRRHTDVSRPASRGPITPLPYTPLTVTQGSPTPSAVSLRPLPAVGIKHLRLKLELTQQTSTLSASTLRLLTTVHYGSVRLTGETTSLPGESRSGVTTDQHGAQWAAVSFPAHRLVYRSLETSPYDLEREMGGYPYAVIQLVLVTQTGSVPLGWVRIKLFSPSHSPLMTHDGERLPWLLLTGDQWHTVFGGRAPENAGVGTTSQLSATGDGLLGNRSQLGALVFDPDAEPRTPVDSPAPPPAQTPGQKTPTPVKTLTPVPVKTPTPTPVAGPASRPQTQTPALPGVNDTFVFYVDGVDNIPDNATITKVTGRFIKLGALPPLEDVLCVPVMSSPARCPRYDYRAVINPAPTVAMDTSMLLLLRVYTVDRLSGKLVVIGSCLCRVFDEQTSVLRVGGHQRALHYGMPDLTKGLGALSHTSLDSAPRVPACTVYYRLVRSDDAYTAPPNLTETNYPRDDGDRALTESERRVVQSYESDRRHPKDVEAMTRRLQQLEEDDSTEVSLSAWLEERLNQKTHLEPSQVAGYLPLDRMVHYRLDKGLSVHIAKAAGLPAGLFTECFAQLRCGADSRDLQMTSEGHGSDDQKFVTLKVDLDSYQAAPQWLDDGKPLHPHWDVHTVLIVQLFGLRPRYVPTADHAAPGTLTDHQGADLQLGAHAGLAWTVLPLFDELYTHAGEHHLPLYRGRPDPDLVDKFSQKAAPDVLTESRDQIDVMKNASLTINVWDGHFTDSELLTPLQREDALLAVVGDPEQYRSAERDTTGDRLRQFVLDGLTTAEQAQGTSSSVYATEKQHFSGLMEKTFLTLMENTLMEAGYGPL